VFDCRGTEVIERVDKHVMEVYARTTRFAKLSFVASLLPALGVHMVFGAGLFFCALITLAALPLVWASYTILNACPLCGTPAPTKKSITNNYCGGCGVRLR